MLFARACQLTLLIAALAATPALASRIHRPATAHHAHHRRSHAKAARHHEIRGQRGIDSERARQIQAALIQKNYLAGTPSGEWDSATEDAMKKYQADHGWQTKLTPDSRALISLGLGPERGADGIPVVAKESAPSPGVTPPAPNTLASTHIIQN